MIERLTADGPMMSKAEKYLVKWVAKRKPPLHTPMLTVRVDDTSLPLEARTFATDLTALGPQHEIQITLQENEWLPSAVEHIRVFIHV